MKAVTAKKRAKVVQTKIEAAAKPELDKKSESVKPEPDVRVVKVGVCPSLSNKSKLSWEWGCTESNELQLRIVGNTGNGSFRQEPVELRAIRAALDKVPKNETVASDCLMPLFTHESANQPSFVFAVLLHEGLVRRSEKEKRRYERVEPEAFDAAVKALMEGKGASANADAKGSKAKGKKVVATKPKNDKKSSKLS